MLEEDQIFKAKSFLRLYKDALKCFHQIAIKNSYNNSVLDFYKKIEISKSQGELKIDSNGNIEKGYAEGYFSRLNSLCQ